MTQFFAMGGYAWYVWMAYGAVALAIVVEIAALRGRRKRAFDELQMSLEPPQTSTMAHTRGAR